MVNLVSAVWMSLGLLTLTLLLASKIRIPYGRHTRTGWGPLISNRWGWFIMELPALLIMPILAIAGPVKLSGLSWLLIGLWAFHYLHRTIIFPFNPLKLLVVGVEQSS